MALKKTNVTMLAAGRIGRKKQDNSFIRIEDKYKLYLLS